MLPYSMKPLDDLNNLCQNNLINLYPNTVIALRISLTLPVTVANEERSFLFQIQINKTLLKKFNKPNKT